MAAKLLQKQAKMEINAVTIVNKKESVDLRLKEKPIADQIIVNLALIILINCLSIPVSTEWLEGKYPK